MKRLDARAVLLDMDGTLIHSTSSVEHVWRLWCARHDVRLSSVLSICHGMRSHEVIQRVAPHLDLGPEIQFLDELEIANTTGGQAIAGAHMFLGQLAGSAWGLVTSASRRVAAHRMRASGLRLPEVLVGSEDVRRGKPDPEPYRLAAKRLCVPCHECVVFEDALAGISSAAAAGCRVIQVGGDEALHGAVEEVIQDWCQVQVGRTGKQCVHIAIKPAMQGQST